MGMLDGIRVLDFTMNAAGPAAGALMSDYGADVIKIERPVVGDECRNFPPIVDGNSLCQCWFNRGKASVTVDLTDPEGTEFIKRLIPDTNIIIESYRPGVMKRFGLDYETVCSIRPDIIYVSVSAFGQKGPYSTRPGYDLIAQAMSGVMSITGEAGGPPMKSGLTLGDLFGGMNAFASAMTALYHWKATGVGQHVDISLVHGLIWMNGSVERCNVGQCAKRQGNHHPTLSPYGLFNGKNGQSIIIAAVNKKIWESLCDVMGRPELKHDPKFEVLNNRNQNQKELIGYIEAWLGRYDDINVPLKLLEQAGVPSCKVYDNNDVFSDPHYRGNNWLVEAPVMPGITSMDTFVARGPNAGFSREPGTFRRAAALGEHNYEVMERCGFPKEEIDRLQAKWAKK